MSFRKGVSYINLTGNIIITTYSILILTVIYIHSCKHSDMGSLQNRLFNLILQVTIFSLVMDIMGRFDGNPGTFYSILNFWGNLLLFMISLTLPSIWLLYVHNQVVHIEKRTIRLSYYLAALNVLNVVMVLAALSKGWFYYIDEGNIYHRGPLYWIPLTVTILLMMSSFVFILVNRKKIESKHYASLILFAVPPFVCIFLQLTFYGVSFMLNSIVLSLLIVYFNIQNRYLYTDYLTGVSNRKRLENQLKKKIAESAENNTFSAILIDMDNFKSINDNFGHDKGDDALATFVQLLKTCLRTNDFIARFGGDEFFIMLDVSDRDILEASVSRIQNTIKKYNESCIKPYKLEFSLGYAVYDPKSHMKVDEFQKQIDTLMYLNKRITKEKIIPRA